MSDLVTVALIAACASTVAACVPAYYARSALKASRDTHRAVNSRLTELLALTRSSSKAKGRLQERQKQARVRKTKL